MSAPDVVAGRVRAPRTSDASVSSIRCRCSRWPRPTTAPPSWSSGSRSAGRWRRSCGCPPASASPRSTSAGTRLWPGVLIGDLLANDYGALPVGTALLQTCGNLAEILIAATLLRRLARTSPPLASIGGVMGMLGALAAGVTVSATIGTLAQLAGSVIDTGEPAWCGGRGGSATSPARSCSCRSPSRGRARRTLALRARGARRRRAAGRAGGAQRGRHRQPRAADVPPVPAADLGGAALRHARRDARRSP